MARTAENRGRARDARIRELLRERDHLDGCPGVYGDGRVEAFDAEPTGDPRTGRPPGTILVTRCMDCGGQRAHVDGTEATLITRHLTADTP